MDRPKYLYHYTSLETLALILENRTLCFNNLMYVDDMEEADTVDMGLFGKYVHVSCWTDEEKESIALWNLYTPNMHGVRIKMPAFPFKKYHFKKGQLFLTEDIETYMNLEKLYEENKVSIVSNSLQLICVEYTDEETKLFPQVRNIDSTDMLEAYLHAKDLNDLNGLIDSNVLNNPFTVNYSFDDIGKYKRKAWAFQKEWRYKITVSPMGLKDSYPPSLAKQQELIRRLENRNQETPYQRLFLDLDENAVQQMEILFGPRMTVAEKILAKALLEKHGLSTRWKESSLRIR